jgi:PAS domain S-box-containing protein
MVAPSWQRYGLAFAIALGAIGLAIVLFPASRPTPGFYILPIAAIALSAWMAGAAPGIFATVVTVIVCLFLEVGFGGSAAGRVLPLAAFVVAGVALSLLGSRNRRHLDRGARDGRTYRAVMEHAINGIWFTDSRGVISEASAGAERMLGYAPGTLVGVDAATLIDRDDLAEMPSRIGEIRAGTPAPGRRRLVRADGSLIVAQGIGQRLPDGRLLTILQDVSDGARVEEALRASEQALRLLAEMIPQIAWSADASGSVTFLNRRWTQYTGVPLEGGGDGAWLAVLHPDDRDRVEVSWRRALEEAEEYREEGRMRGADGEYRWFLIMGQPLRDAAGSIDQWYGTCTDVDELKRGEREVAALLRREQEARAQAEDVMRRTSFLARAGEILASSLIHDHAAQGLVDLIVPEFADCCALMLLSGDEELRIAGLRHRIAASEHALATGLERHRERILAGEGFFGRALRTGQPEIFRRDATFEERFAAYPDDARAFIERIDLRSIVVLPLAARGDTLGVIALLTDGSSGRELDEDGVAFAQELARRASVALDNARLYAEAERANQAKDRFLAMLSHELRTPLTPTLAAVEALAEDELPAASRPLVDIIHRNVELEARLIDDLLDLTRIIKGKVRLAAEVVDFDAIVRNVIDICRSDLAVRQLLLSIDLGADRHHVGGDPARLQQVLWNLLKNAIKFTPDGGRVAISTKCVGDHLVIDVADTGIGIDPAMLPTIFNAFEQAEQPPGITAGGLGLGLAISRSLVAMHGGELVAESRGRGNGATFTLRLPLAFPDETTPASDVAGASPSLTPGTCRILVVDDHHETTSLLRLLLERRGYQVATAFSEESAFEAAAGGGFDLLISDIDLGDGNGISLLRRLRERHSLRAIAVSGFGTEADVERSRNAGFSLHLIKPFTSARLHEAIVRVMREPAS